MGTDGVRLEDTGLPDINGITELSKLLELNRDTVAAMAFGTTKFYRSFQIPKRSGGSRLISAPYPSLLEVQRWISTTILARIPIHEAAHGYVKGRSIISNASPHCAKQCLLKMDLRDFFPTITLNRVIGLFSSFGYSQSVSLFLARLVTLNGELPQGSAASPAISNVICWQLDSRLQGLATLRSLNYTRYADDLCFSGEYINSGIVDIISEIISNEGFAVNSEKTRLVRGHGRRVVTGISVVNAQPKLPRSLKRMWRAEIHSCIENGVQKHCEKFGLIEFGYRSSLLGRLSHWAAVEPNNAYPKKCCQS